MGEHLWNRRWWSIPLRFPNGTGTMGCKARDGRGKVDWECQCSSRLSKTRVLSGRNAATAA
eukprot:3653980-Amphidinium_carterae.1